MADRTCSIKGCPQPHSGRGYCGAHYQRWYRYGDPLGEPEPIQRPEICTFAGCSKPNGSRGYCTGHLRQLKRGIELRPLQARRAPYGDTTCSIDGCPEKAIARGWCRTHYQRWRVHRDPHFVTPPRGPGVRKYWLDETYFDVIGDEERAYWLGFISADGCVYDTKNRYGLAVDLAAVDQGHLEKFRAALGSDRPLGRTRVGYCLSVDSQHMAKILIGHGATPRKTFTLRPWSGPADLMPHYWRGCFDGDGSISKVRGRHEWALSLAGNRYVIDAFAEWVRDVTDTRASPRPHRSVWSFTVCGGAKPQRLAEALYGAATISLDRKLERAQDLLNVDLDTDWRDANERRRVALAGVPISQRGTTKRR